VDEGALEELEYAGARCTREEWRLGVGYGGKFMHAKRTRR
jgi:hypothetical protein